MTQTTVSATPQSPPSAATPAAPPQPAIDAAALQRQIDELKQSLGEKDRAIEFWQSKSARPEPAAKAEPVEEEPEADVLDVITSKGAKGLDELLARRGYVRKSEVEQITDAKAQAFAKEQQLLKEYPELGDHKSDFFKATAQHYGHLVKSGVAPAVAMELAAERTELAQIRDGKRLTPQQKKEEDKAQREQERRARAAAQAGDRGVRTPAESEEDEDLTAEQKHIAAAMGISEEAYKARAKKGVAMRGVK
ncbi:MAG: hypothetical protein JO345_21940 [Streptosporangiaceae bacterium]|nr:hypothetical protein [Streptosporangiaceae bacterium]